VFPAKVTANPMGFRVSERTTDNVLTEANRLPALTPGTRNVTFNAVGIGGLVIFSTEEEEDSIIPILPFARDELVMAMQNAMETSVLNGDDAGIHSDYDIANGANVATDPRTAWDGYRIMAVAPSTDTSSDLSTFNLDNLRGLRAKMGKYGVNPADLAWVTSPKTYLGKFLLLDEVSTVDLFGPMAIVLSGQLGALDGIPIVVSEFSRDDVSATGFNTSGGPNTKSVATLVNKSTMVWGDVREMRVLDMAWPLTDQVVVMVKGRMAFKSLYDVTTEPVVGMAYNI
jgi:HK97 family phage major capsid protein